MLNNFAFRQCLSAPRVRVLVILVCCRAVHLLRPTRATRIQNVGFPLGCLTFVPQIVSSPANRPPNSWTVLLCVDTCITVVGFPSLSPSLVCSDGRTGLIVWNALLSFSPLQIWVTIVRNIFWFYLSAEFVCRPCTLENLPTPRHYSSFSALCFASPIHPYPCRTIRQVLEGFVYSGTVPGRRCHARHFPEVAVSAC